MVIVFSNLINSVTTEWRGVVIDGNYRLLKMSKFAQLATPFFCSRIYNEQIRDLLVSPEEPRYKLEVPRAAWAAWAGTSTTVEEIARNSFDPAPGLLAWHACEYI